MAEKQDSRYPYTYAADFVRSLAMATKDDLNIQVPLLSRAQAANIWHTLAELWKVDEHWAVGILAGAKLSSQNDEK